MFVIYRCFRYYGCDRGKQMLYMKFKYGSFDQYLLLFLQLSFGPIGWLMISEVFPLRLRGRGLSIAVLLNFGANAVVTFSFSPLEVRKDFQAFYFASSFTSENFWCYSLCECGCLV